MDKTVFCKGATCFDGIKDPDPECFAKVLLHAAGSGKLSGAAEAEVGRFFEEGGSPTMMLRQLFTEFQHQAG